MEIFEERPGTDSKANRDRRSQLPAREEPSSSVMSSSGPSVTRRQFIERSAATAAVSAGATAAIGAVVTKGARPAILGGKPARTGGWPGWPVFDANDEAALIEALRSGNWFRYRGGSKMVDQFEATWAKSVGTNHCQATANGTSALVTSLAAVEVGPGDEVVVPPYTFIATINAVLLHHALPVFVDSDIETAQMDADRIEARVNANTKAVIPVHLGGAPCHMDKIMAIAKKHGLKVIEDACQAHTAEWRGKRAGSLGHAGCFSFQNSKNLTSGEGGAITTNDAALFARAQAFHNNSIGVHGDDGHFTANGGNFRLTEFQAAILLEQQKRLAQQAARREANGAYLGELLDAIPGVRAKRVYPGTTRHGYHLFLCDYDPQQFAGMSKQRFLAAVSAEGIPVGGGYGPTNRMPFVERVLASRGFRRVYSAKRLKQYREENVCPSNDRMCATTFWLTQNVLLAARQDMEVIATAIAKVHDHASVLV